MKITSSSISRRRIEIKDLSSIQKTALSLLAGHLGLVILEERPQYNQSTQVYLHGHQSPWIETGRYTVILEANTIKGDFYTTYSELISLLLTMQSLNLAGWHVVDSTSDV